MSHQSTLSSLESEIIQCRKCPRLVAWREQVAQQKRKAFADHVYWGKPVPGFGDFQARVLVVGLAPGAHGSNRTGRMFTGDGSGDFLYPALQAAGFANQGRSSNLGDGLALTDMFITAICRCAPPGNKPSTTEMDNCQDYLIREIDLIHPSIIVVLGRIAFERVVKIYAGGGQLTFKHGAIHPLNKDQTLICSYHPSRQNTQTGRLTKMMFDQVWNRTRTLLRSLSHETSRERS